MKKINQLLLIYLLISVCTNTLAQQTAQSFVYNGETFGFWRFLPSNYTANGAYKHSLIIFLHGVGEKGSGIQPDLDRVVDNAPGSIPYEIKRGATMTFGAESFIVLSPQLSPSEGLWPPKYINAMIAYAIQNLNIDQKSIHVTGLSLGGGGCWKYFDSNTNPYVGVIATLAPVSGTADGYPYNTTANNILNSLTGLWAFHAVDDANAQTTALGTTAKYQFTTGYNTTTAKYTYYKTGGHGNWDKAYAFNNPIYVVDSTNNYYPSANVNNASASFTQSPNLYEWMLANKRTIFLDLPKPSNTLLNKLVENEIELHIYPNPVVDVVNYIISNNVMGNYKASIINQYGQVVKTVRISKTQKHVYGTLQVAELPTGYYQINIVHEKGNVLTKAFCK